MSNKNGPTYDDQSLQSALAHIGERSANAPCPFCGCRTWTVETEGSDVLKPYLAYIHFSASHTFGPAPVVPAIIISCDDCGFIRQHNLPHILSKLNGAR